MVVIAAKVYVETVVVVAVVVIIVVVIFLIIILKVTWLGTMPGEHLYS